LRYSQRISRRARRPRPQRMTPMPSRTCPLQPPRTTLFPRRSSLCIPSRWLRRVPAFSAAPSQFPPKFFLCHRSKICARKSFPCHTSKNTRLKVLHLPHIQKLAGVGVLLLIRNPKRTSVLRASQKQEIRPCWRRSSLFQDYPPRVAEHRLLPASVHPYLVTCSPWRVSLPHYFFSGDLHENYKSFSLSRRFRRNNSLPVSLRRRPPVSHAPSCFTSISLSLPCSRGTATPRTGPHRR
jgi:hypothetical protein